MKFKIIAAIILAFLLIVLTAIFSSGGSPEEGTAENPVIQVQQ